MKIVSASVCVAGWALVVTSLSAAPVAITPGQLGIQNVTATGFPNLICPADVASLGCGGAFTANIGTINNATIWCVDSQLDVSQGQNYTAYIERIQPPSPNPNFNDGNNVRYGSIATSNTSSTPHWVFDLSGYALSNPDQALTRYELAAILISQYQPNDGAPLNNSTNQSIQDAIWHLTENTSFTQPNLNGPINVNAPAGGDWISYAVSILNSNTFDFSQWAVVSGGYDPVSNSLYTDSTHAVQTFLVQVTPEPRFYGVLLVGLLALVAIVFRRRQTA